MKRIGTCLLLSFCLVACTKKNGGDRKELPLFSPTYVDLNKHLPAHIPKMDIPADNPTSEEGIKLGRKLFYDPILSADGTQSCSSCHNQHFGFTDNGSRYSTGIDGFEGNRNAMQIVNAGLRKSFFWDGRAASLEDQALQPVTNEIEMHNTWTRVIDEINFSGKYRAMSYAAFGISNMDSMLVVKAIAQFERTLISGNSKFDKWKRGEVSLSPIETLGLQLFYRDRTASISGADCFHCHAAETDFTDNLFHNNGLDEVFADSGRAKVTGSLYDLGKFKTPTLRNIEYTAPYMHDGRFPDLESVIKFYSTELKFSPTIDPLMKNVHMGGVQLNSNEQGALISFLKTLSDPDFINNPDFSAPE